LRIIATKKVPNNGKIIALSLLESLHKRVAYLKGDVIITWPIIPRKKSKTLVTIKPAAVRASRLFAKRGVED